MNNKEMIITAIIIMFATFLLRSLPFIIIGKSNSEKKYIKFLGDMLPYSMIALLIIYCIKDIKYPYAIAEIISIFVVIVLHILKRNALFSIGLSTLLYMFLVQVIFV